MNDKEKIKLYLFYIKQDKNMPLSSFLEVFNSVEVCVNDKTYYLLGFTTEKKLYTRFKNSIDMNKVISIKRYLDHSEFLEFYNKYDIFNIEETLFESKFFTTPIEIVTVRFVIDIINDSYDELEYWIADNAIYVDILKSIYTLFKNKYKKIFKYLGGFELIDILESFCIGDPSPSCPDELRLYMDKFGDIIKITNKEVK